jgi:hypothetical protein
VSRAGRIVRIALVVGLVAFCAYAGLGDGMRAWSESRTAAQRVASGTQLLYGSLSVALLLAMAFRTSWVEPLLWAWGTALTLTGTLATVVWGEQGWAAAAAAFASIAAIAALVVWAWRAHRRRDPAAG